MKKTEVQNWLFTFSIVVIILVFCLGAKYGEQLFGEKHLVITDSTSINKLQLRENSQTETFVFKQTEKNFIILLSYFEDKFPNAEIISITREVDNSNLPTNGFKVTFKFSTENWEHFTVISKKPWYYSGL